MNYLLFAENVSFNVYLFYFVVCLLLDKRRSLNLKLTIRLIVRLRVKSNDLLLNELSFELNFCCWMNQSCEGSKFHWLKLTRRKFGLLVLWHRSGHCLWKIWFLTRVSEIWSIFKIFQKSSEIFEWSELKVLIFQILWEKLFKTNS